MPKKATKTPPAKKTPPKPISKFRGKAVPAFVEQKKQNGGVLPLESRGLSSESVVPTAPGDYVDPLTGLTVDAFGVPYVTQHRDENKKQNRRRTAEERQLVNQRIEEARGLLALSFSTGDAKRALATKWNMSPHGVVKYIKIAQKRNQGLLEKNERELKGDSLTFWSRKLQEAAARYQRGQNELRDAYDRLKKVDELLKVYTEKQDAKGILSVQKMMDSCENMIDHAKKLVSAAGREQLEIQDRIDRLVGNNAPDRIALTNVKGEDIAPREPVTKIESRDRLVILLDQFRTTLPPDEQGKIPDADEIVKPLEIPFVIVEDETHEPEGKA